MESNYREKRQRRSDNRLKAPSEYKEKIVDLRRVTRVVAGGKRMTFRATIIVGNEKGKIGVGIGKGLDTPAAIAKAKNYAMKNVFSVPIINGSSPHEVESKFSAARL